MIEIMNIFAISDNLMCSASHDNFWGIIISREDKANHFIVLHHNYGYKIEKIDKCVYYYNMIEIEYEQTC